MSITEQVLKGIVMAHQAIERATSLTVDTANAITIRKPDHTLSYGLVFINKHGQQLEAYLEIAPATHKELKSQYNRQSMMLGAENTPISPSDLEILEQEKDGFGLGIKHSIIDEIVPTNIEIRPTAGSRHYTHCIEIETLCHLEQEGGKKEHEPMKFKAYFKLGEPEPVPSMQRQASSLIPNPRLARAIEINAT